MAKVKQWAYDPHIEINKSIYFEHNTMKLIADLKFNPSKGVAHLSLALKVLSILTCRARTSAEMEHIWERKHVMAETKNTRQLDKLLCLSKGVTQAPADNFRELKVNIATFMSLVWVLFRSDCDYYKGL